MNILLIHKSNYEGRDSESIIMPNGLLYTSAFLKENGHDNQLLNLSNYDWGKTRELIKKSYPEIAGITCYTYNRSTVFRLADIIKENNPKCKVVLGGPHASVLYEQILEKHPSIDIIVIGEGEQTFLDIVKGEPLEKIKGIAFRKEDVIVTEKREPLDNLDKLTIPAKYYSYKRIITARGCPGQCIFCDTPHLWGRNIRFRSTNHVVDELELLNKKHQRSFFIFSDDTFTADKNRVIDICKEIIDRKLEIIWDCRSRVNFIDEERLDWMKKAGCVSISYGIESGSEKILKKIKKYTTKEQIIKAAKLTRDFGFFMNFFIIVGSPGEDNETIQETIQLIKQTKPHSIIPAIMEITPATELCNNSELDQDIWIKDSTDPIYYNKNKEQNRSWLSSIMDFFKKNKPSFDYNEDELRSFIDKYGDSQSFNKLGDIFLKDNDRNKAKMFFYTAIEKNKGNNLAYNNMGVVYGMKGDYGSALEYLEKSALMDPEDTFALNNLALTYFRMENYDKAKEAFKKAIELDPGNMFASSYMKELS